MSTFPTLGIKVNMQNTLFTAAVIKFCNCIYTSFSRRGDISIKYNYFFNTFVVISIDFLINIDSNNLFFFFSLRQITIIYFPTYIKFHTTFFIVLIFMPFRENEGWIFF